MRADNATSTSVETTITQLQNIAPEADFFLQKFLFGVIFVKGEIDDNQLALFFPMWDSNRRL